MRFTPESDHGANNGLKVARDFLEPVKGKTRDNTQKNILRLFREIPLDHLL